MAASSGDDIPAQLAALLGNKSVRIRKTDETPPRISVIDVATLVTGKHAGKAAQDVGFVKDRYPDLAQKLGQVKLADSLGRRGKRSTPVTCATGIIEIVMLLPGRMAARARRQAAELFVRYMGGDLTLVDEVCRIRVVGDQLSVRLKRIEDSQERLVELAVAEYIKQNEGSARAAAVK